MPWIIINLLEGRSPAQKRALHQAVAATVAETLQIPIERVRIQLTEMPPDHNSIGGIPADQRP